MTDIRGIPSSVGVYATAIATSVGFTAAHDYPVIGIGLNAANDALYVLVIDDAGALRPMLASAFTFRPAFNWKTVGAA